MSIPTFAKQTHLTASRINHNSLVWGVLLTCLWGRHTLWAQKPAGELPPAPVVAEAVEERDVVIDLTFVGTVTPTRTSLVGSTVEGRVVKFLVREGDQVEAGQILAQLRLTALEIELLGAKAELALLEEQWEDLKVSQPQEIKQADARLRAAKAQYEYANRQLQRGRGLAATSAITTEQVEEMVSLADSAQSVLNERTSAHELAISIAPVKEAQALARIEVQKETIRGLEDKISEHTITAPFNGYVTKEHTEVGQWIDKGGPVVELIELEFVEVEISVLENYISELRQQTQQQEGTKTVQLLLEALPGEPFEGEIVSIVPRADTQSRTFPVKIRVRNRVRDDGGTPVLKPGMFARVTLPVRTIQKAVMIPKDALVLEKSEALAQNQPTVWVVEPSSDRSSGGGRRIRDVKVTVAYDVSEGDFVQVTGPAGPDGSLPLKEEDLVITEGNERLNRNMTVVLKEKKKEAAK